MTDLATLDAYGVLTEPDTLKIERLLPGPAERIWSYLTDSDMRRKWLAAGAMDLQIGAPFELVWRNDELTDPPGAKPDGFGEEHRMQCRILAFDSPRKLAFTWGKNSEVSFELKPMGKDVLLTLIHRRTPDRSVTLMVSSGWHAHLDVLAARLAGKEPRPFWDEWNQLYAEYDRRLP